MGFSGIQVLLVAVFAMCASAQEQAMPAARVAVSNFLVVMQSGTGYPRPIFTHADVATTSNSIVVSAPGFQITFGNALANTNALVTYTWTNEIPDQNLVVQHLAHANVQPIPVPPVFSIKPRGADPVHMEKAPLIFKRPTEKDIQVLLQCFADQGIYLRPIEKETPNQSAHGTR